MAQIEIIREFAEKVKEEVYPFLQAEMYNKKHFITGDSLSDKLLENQNIGILKAQDVLSKWFKVKIDELLKEYEKMESKYEMKLNGYRVEVFFDSSEGWFVRLGDVKEIIDRLSYINDNLKHDCEMWKNGYRKVYKELGEVKQNERQKFFDEIKNLFK